MMGQGVEKDDSQAVYWFSKAALQGETSAQMKLADLYWLGLGVAKNKPLAYAWLKLAQDPGDAIAKGALRKKMSELVLEEKKQGEKLFFELQKQQEAAIIRYSYYLR